MRPPYEISPTILALVASISEKLGEAKSSLKEVPSPELRKKNQIQTIHSSLKIEGNTLSEAQMTAILENKRVIGPPKDILEVKNAIEVYNSLELFDPYSEKSFLKAHALLMEELISPSGRYRSENVGIAQGTKITHLAPPAKRVPLLMKDLFEFLGRKEEIPLISSCVFHYELEFIHPFLDGNGRMGRLWQTLILADGHPIFLYLPFESLISQNQESYYGALSESDKQGSSTSFITFMLRIIDQSLEKLLNKKADKVGEAERMDYFLGLGIKEFSRKEYAEKFPGISLATASRDLQKAVKKGIIEKQGTKNQTRYYIPK